MGLVARKPVFGVSNKVRFKPAYSATEISQKIEIALDASIDMTDNKGTDQTGPMCRPVPGAGLRLCCSQTTEDRFLTLWPICPSHI